MKKIDNTAWREARWAGDGAILLIFGDNIDPRINRIIHRVAKAVRRAAIAGVWGIVPAYTTLLVEYDPSVTTGDEVISRLQALRLDDEDRTPRCFRIPVLYGGDAGPDLLEVAQTLGLTPDEVVRRHTAAPYLIYCLGFSPGFPLCGMLAPELRIPRRSSPRTLVPAGSVAIAGFQTGVYPTQSPGGWHLLGQTPVRLFDLHRDPPIIYEPGDYLWFRAVDRQTFEELRELSRQGQTVVEEVPYASD